MKYGFPGPQRLRTLLPYCFCKWMKLQERLGTLAVTSRRWNNSDNQQDHVLGYSSCSCPYCTGCRAARNWSCSSACSSSESSCHHNTPVNRTADNNLRHSCLPTRTRQLNVKRRVQLFMRIPSQSLTGRHLPYGPIQCYYHPTQVNAPVLTPASKPVDLPTIYLPTLLQGGVHHS